MHHREIIYIYIYIYIYIQIKSSVVNRWPSLLGIKNEQYTTTASNWVQTQDLKLANCQLLTATTRCRITSPTIIIVNKHTVAIETAQLQHLLTKLIIYLYIYTINYTSWSWIIRSLTMHSGSQWSLINGSALWANITKFDNSIFWARSFWTRNT